MNLTSRTQATMLLTVHVTARSTAAPEPLNLREWNRLARWLDERELAPESLVRGNPWAILADWDDSRIATDRLLRLLERGASLALAVDRWTSMGIWVLNRSEPGYPRRLRNRLKWSSPALLFGCGDIATVERRGVAIVGSRNASLSDRQLAQALGQATVQAGYTVVSGGARGVDEWAADGAITAGGQVVAVVADSLVRIASRKPYRDHLTDGSAVLVTPYSPDTGFSAGNALGRNRLIYCLADTAVAICSSNGSGGTFSGASQNLRAGWVPMWVAPTDDPASGNPALIGQGARWLPSVDTLDVDTLFAVADRDVEGVTPSGQSGLL